MSAAARQWRYAAENAAGAVVSGVIAATDLRSAETALRSRRLVPLSINAHEPSLFSRLAFAPHGDRLRLKELSELTARLRDLLTAGIPVAHALRLASEQANSEKERAFLNELLADVRGGRTLTDALARNAFETPRLFRALIESGEALGALSKQMERLAVHYEEVLRLRREIIAQLAYPAALSVLIIAALFFLSFLVLPQFEAIFSASDSKAPPDTRLVLDAGAAIRRYWPFAPLAVLGAAIGLRLAFKRYAAAIERMCLALPIAGRILRYADYGAFLRTLATLLDGGAPIARAMPLARQGMSVKILQAEVEEAESAVRVGDRLAGALKIRTSCPADLISFLEIGEETGELARLTGQAAGRAEAFVGSSIRRFMTLLAPALTALMGLLTAGVIAAVMTGVLSLNETIY